MQNKRRMRGPLLDFLWIGVVDVSVRQIYRSRNFLPFSFLSIIYKKAFVSNQRKHTEHRHQ